MKLSEVDRKLLSYLQLQADQPLESASRALKISVHKLRSSLKRLRDHKIIEPYAILNHHRLGLVQFDIYFAASSVAKISSDELLSHCLSDQNVPWVVKVGGDFQVGITVLVKTPHDLECFLTRLSEKYGDIFQSKSVVLCLGYSVFPRKYISDLAHVPQEVSCFGSSTIVHVDEVDMKILNRFSTDPLSSGASMAKSIGIKTSTLQYRLKRLKDSGIIVGVVYTLNHAMIGVQTFRFFLQFKNLATSLLEDFHDFCRRYGQVSYLTRCVGAWDHEVTLEVEVTSDVECFQQALSNRFGESLSSLRSVPVFEESIAGPYPFSSSS